VAFDDGRFEGPDGVLVPECESDVVEAFHEPPAGVVVDVERRSQVAGSDLTGLEIDGHLGRRTGLDESHQRLDRLRRQLHRQQAALQRVARFEKAPERMAVRRARTADQNERSSVLSPHN